MSNHYCLGRIDFGVGSCACWCVDPPRNLVVFLHGFTGAAVATWHDISANIRREGLFGDADIVFLGYDSLSSRAGPMSGLIYQFLEEFLADPASFSNRYLYYARAKRAPFAYERVLVVAHSLGGALIRQAAARLAADNNPYTDRLQLLLFAPAHKGSNTLSNVNAAIASGSIMAALKVGLFRRVPILEDLPVDCRFITDIEIETLNQLSLRRRQCLVATKVHFGQYENTVETRNFAQDPHYRTVPHRNHTDICKTAAGNRLVISEIEECLR
ncbi:MAG TPA: hypothetical protein VGO04_10560 [Ensifer sp.]|jgi:hypothetical protein|uniref:esterase/lipase family protein n=1 Tax=Ensifer sp. TaxID=1872086 RepID=UPI002E0EE118|nr:hypothetical protein [Ensifer sp.]